MLCIKSLGNKPQLWLSEHYFSLLLFRIIFHFCGFSIFFPSRQNKPDWPFKTITKHVCSFSVCYQCSIPSACPPTLAAAANATGAMQHGEVCATAWWSILFILKWGCSCGRYREEWNNKHEALRRREVCAWGGVMVGGLMTAKWQLRHTKWP